MEKLSKEIKEMVEMGYWGLYRLKDEEKAILVIPEVTCPCHRQEGAIFELNLNGEILNKEPIDYRKVHSYQVDEVIHLNS